jgi:nitrite reductase/ring-hydroxylating ferredoxin subunit
MKHRLLAVDELQPGEARRVEVGNLELLLVKAPDGSVHALRDRCPHQGARLSHGLVLEHVDAEDVGTYALTSGQYVIRCPWHGMEYDVTTGSCPADESYRVPSFNVTVEDGQIVLERPSASETRTARG